MANDYRNISDTFYLAIINHLGAFDWTIDEISNLLSQYKNDSNTIKLEILFTNFTRKAFSSAIHELMGWEVHEFQFPCSEYVKDSYDELNGFHVASKVPGTDTYFDAMGIHTLQEIFKRYGAPDVAIWHGIVDP